MYNEFRLMNDSELANVMVNYINRIEHLEHLISSYLSKELNAITAEQIRREYREIKNEIRKDADYLNLVRNRRGSEVYMGAFSPSIREAAAFGFTVSVTGAVDQKMYNAVSEAHYKMTKYYSLEEWGQLL